MQPVADLSPFRPTPADRGRQVGVTIAALFCVVGTLFGTGAIGTRVAESSGGSLSTQATRLAPAGPAFTIWSVIYVGLFAYTLWQWLPRNIADARARRTGWLAAASMVLNAAWLLVTQVDLLWVSVAVILALALVVGTLVARLTELEPGTVASRVVLDGTFGLYLGWVSVATGANVTAALVASGVDVTDPIDDLLAVIVLVVVAGLGVVFAHAFGGRFAVAAAMAWGLAWIVVARLGDAPHSPVTAGAAAVAAVVVLGAAALERVRGRRAA